MGRGSHPHPRLLHDLEQKSPFFQLTWQICNIVIWALYVAMSATGIELMM